MKKLAIAALAVGIIFFAAPKSDACSTHGYVRASTLNDLFQGVSDSSNELAFEAPSGTQGQGGGNLSDPNLDTGHYDDGHAFGWKMKGHKNSSGTDGGWDTVSIFGGTGVESAQTQLDDIIASIEQSLSESYDKSYAD